jgi:L-lactate dehydrogenase complex protein LldG
VTSREEILGRIAAARVTPTHALRPPSKASQRTRAEIVAQFQEYAADYQAEVHLVSRHNIARKIAELADNSVVLVPKDIPEGWVQSVQIVREENLTTKELEQFGVVLTGSALAIAETGTIVLDAGLGQGRRAISLIPDHHLCVVRAKDIFDSLPEAVEALAAAAQVGRPTTWISGPSATSDIELSRVEGVHGPRVLDILILEE